MKKILFAFLFCLGLLKVNAQSIDTSYYYLISSETGTNLNLTVSGDTLITKAKNKVNSWSIADLDTTQHTCMLKSLDGFYLSQTTAGVLKARKESGTVWTLTLDENLAGTISGSYENTIYYLEYQEDGSVSLSSSSGGNSQKWKFNNTGKKLTN